MTAALSEIQIQVLFRNRARMVCPGVSIVAVPNAGKRTQWAARQAKMEGMSSGFPDLMCFWRDGGFAAIEMKTPKGRISENQAEWLDRLSGLGFSVSVCRGADEALEFLRSCGAPFNDRIDRL